MLAGLAQFLVREAQLQKAGHLELTRHVSPNWRTSSSPPLPHSAFMAQCSQRGVLPLKSDTPSQQSQRGRDDAVQSIQAQESESVASQGTLS